MCVCVCVCMCGPVPARFKTYCLYSYYGMRRWFDTWCGMYFWAEYIIGENPAL